MRDWMVLEELSLVVTDDGFTREEQPAPDRPKRPVRVATQWQAGGRKRFQRWLVDRLVVTANPAARM